MRGILMRRADALAGCTEGFAEEAELKEIVDLLEAHDPSAGRSAVAGRQGVDRLRR